MCKKINNLRKDLVGISKFLITFNLLSIPLYLIILFNISSQTLQNFVASLVASILKIFGYKVSQNGFNLSLLYLNKLNQIEISWDCTGWKSMYVLFALTLSTPSKTWKERWKFLLISLPFLFLMNLIRIITTIIFVLNYNLSFDLIHNFFWREGLIFILLVLWMLWIKRLFTKKTKLFWGYKWLKRLSLKD